MPDRTCEHDDTTECVPCFQQRISSVTVGASATPSRYISRSRTKPVQSKEASNRWERGQPTDERGMPYLDEKGVRVNTKKLAETRHKYRKHETINVEAS